MAWIDSNTLAFGDEGDTILTRTRAGVLELRLGPAATGGKRVAAKEVGEDFYVDAATGADTNNGLAASSPFATITAAIAAAVNGRGDRIWILPGSYDENVVVNKDYVSLIGAMPGGYARPDIVPTAGKGISVQAQGVVLLHCRFASADDDPVHIEGNGFIVEDCVCDGDGNGVATAGIRLKGNADDDSYTASEGVIRGNLIRGGGGYGLVFEGAENTVGVGVTDVDVVGNRFVANTGVDIATLDNSTTDATYSAQRVRIAGNSFEDKNKTTYIDLTTANGGAASAQTGMIADNFFAADTVDGTAVKMVGTGFTFAGNRGTAGIVNGSGLD